MTKRALLSVTDKSELETLAKGLVAAGYEILSTGGTMAYLQSHGIAVTSLADFTGQPEILDGRVKTLQPKVHGGLLYDRDNPDHVAQLAEQGIAAIDMVVVNLYDFAKAQRDGLAPEQAIESIDIGGPTMLRAAAKNISHTLSVIDPADYPAIIAEVAEGAISRETRMRCAQKTFAAISRYDAAIAGYFSAQLNAADDTAQEPAPLAAPQKVKTLRYGENPHQQGYLYTAVDSGAAGFLDVTIIQGKELSYNNYLDLDAASSIVYDLMPHPAVAIIKHTNPCGAACSATLPQHELYQKALTGDPRSAFGSIIAFNQEVTETTAETMSGLFVECIIAPSFAKGALEVFSRKKNLRLVSAPFLKERGAAHKPLTVKSIRGATLVQDADTFIPETEGFKTVTERAPSAAETDDLAFAMTIAKHVKSNAIVLVKDLTVLTVGAGQMSRIDSATFCADKALEDGKVLKGAAMASDAFFPFRDTVDLAAKYGVASIVQPGGSVRDEESIAACNEQGIAMVFTGHRHFKH